jgi:hypothetical protein
MIKIDKETKKQLLEIWSTRKIGIEGNLLKLIDTDGDEEFHQYILESSEKDTQSRKKRLELTKQIQLQNKDLVSWKEENEKIQKELKESLVKTEETMLQLTQSKEEAEGAKVEALIAKEEAIKAKQLAEQAKNAAINDLDVMQKKTQFELISVIVRVALFVILGVGIVTTVLYAIVLIMGLDNPIIASTWSNLLGILLTNSFSIIGTIMGIKYASDGKKENS